MENENLKTQIRVRHSRFDSFLEKIELEYSKLVKNLLSDLMRSEYTWSNHMHNWYTWLEQTINWRFIYILIIKNDLFGFDNVSLVYQNAIK